MVTGGIDTPTRQRGELRFEVVDSKSAAER